MNKKWGLTKFTRFSAICWKSTAVFEGYIGGPLIISKQQLRDTFRGDAAQLTDNKASAYTSHQHTEVENRNKSRWSLYPLLAEAIADNETIMKYAREQHCCSPCDGFERKRSNKFNACVYFGRSVFVEPWQRRDRPMNQLVTSALVLLRFISHQSPLRYPRPHKNLTVLEL